MKQDCLYNCLLMHCHKSIADALDTVKIGKGLLVPTKNAISILETLSKGMRIAECKMSPPRFKTFRRLRTSYTDEDS